MRRMRWHIPKRANVSASPSRSSAGASKSGRIPASIGFNDSLVEPGDWADSWESPHTNDESQSRDDSAFDGRISPPDQRVLPAGRIADGWRLRKMIIVRIELDADESYIASDNVFAVHGSGETKADAMSDYIASLIDYYELLSVRSCGDEPTAALFRHLQGYLERTKD